MPRLLCIYQHAPTLDAPGFYRHRHYFAELVRRGWDVDLVSCPVDYLTGTTPERYATKSEDGILSPDAIAENYWNLHRQPRNAWTHELDLRPWSETW